MRRRTTMDHIILNYSVGDKVRFRDGVLAWSITHEGHYYFSGVLAVVVQVSRRLLIVQTTQGHCVDCTAEDVELVMPHYRPWEQQRMLHV